MRTYLAEIHLDSPKPHKEYATITIEDNYITGKPAPALEDPNCHEPWRDSYFSKLREIAAVHCGTGSVKLAVLYRVVSKKQDRGGDIMYATLSFVLNPVFRFDDKGENPVPVIS